ncbi:MAG: TRAP transporter substrate-binding protein [Geminicoccaceae bacterium]|nr:MAG: TRAP transporter substrate-binding protein [Geminicoccaceae bacterium]
MRLCARLTALLAAAPALLVAGAVEAQTLRLATVVTAPHPWIDAAEAFKAELEAETDGRLTVSIFPSAQLGNDQTVIDEMRIGTIDMIIGGTQNASPFVPEFGLFSLNYLFSGMEAFEQATDPEGELFAHFEETVRDHGVGIRLLALTGGGTRNLSARGGPVLSPDDMVGLRMRVPGSQMDARMWQATGALTTSLPWSEIYTGMQTGVVEAFESSISGYYGSKLFEVAPYHSLTEHQIMMSHISISDIAFNRLSAEDQELVTRAARNAAVLGTAKGVEYDVSLLERLEADHGVTVSEVDKAAFMAVSAPLHDEFAASLGVTEALEMLRALQ